MERPPQRDAAERTMLSGDRCDKTAKRLSLAAKIHYMR
jgi:hypothetical protein